MNSQARGGSGANSLTAEIVDELENNGLDQDEYRLNDFIDLDALSRVVTSGSNVAVEFSVRGIPLRVSQDRIETTNGN